MKYFRETSHLSEIIEASEKESVIIFKFSAECASSDRLRNKLEKGLEDKTINSPIYLVTVQKLRVLSGKIEEYFGIKHESPQIIVLKNGKTTYSAHHNEIQLENFVLVIQN
jgi:bacillithiol system protein YtxJ